MAKPNYAFEKRKRDLEKKAKQAEKLRRKQQAAKPATGEVAEPASTPPAGA